MFRKWMLNKECCEEICSREEAREIFEDDEKTEIFWDYYIHGKNPKLVTILNNATEILKDQMEINELRKELTGKKQEIRDLEDQLLTKLESCVDGEL
ncbi:vitamin K-dependent protein Z-like isoform X2 [Chiloscyllium punctatum]